MKPTVAMVIEGAYPYIVGGVAAWCHLLISEIKEVNFALVLILPAEYRKRKPKYTYPKNVISVDEIYLDEEYPLSWYDKTRLQEIEEEEIFEVIEKFHDFMKVNTYTLFEDVTNYPLVPELLSRSNLALKTIFRMYDKYLHRESLMKYFWTWKSTHFAIFNIINYPLPNADIYHAVSTGYAGLVSAIARIKKRVPFLLTEHGIYAMEREEEIERAEFIDKDAKKLWIKFYHSLCRISYSFADKIITLYRGNMLTEVANNANIDKISIIPNGVNYELYSSIKREKDGDFVNVGLVARVVPIKDVKTYIKTAYEVLQQEDKVRFYIVGPTDENEEYYEECVEMVKEYNIEDRVIFTGRVDMKEFYKKLDIVMLTSVREAQPLTLLEAMAVGIPCIATDVGSCSELLEGVGFIKPPKDYKGLADAVLLLVRNESLRKNLGKKGQEKVKKYFDIKDMINNYRNLYLSMAEKRQEIFVGWNRF
jgi:glycosyltransferase involved in cell wall biosynthesis